MGLGRDWVWRKSDFIHLPVVMYQKIPLCIPLFWRLEPLSLSGTSEDQLLPKKKRSWAWYGSQKKSRERSRHGHLLQHLTRACLGRAERFNHRSRSIRQDCGAKAGLGATSRSIHGSGSRSGFVAKQGHSNTDTAVTELEPHYNRALGGAGQHSQGLRGHTNPWHCLQ